MREQGACGGGSGGGSRSGGGASVRMREDDEGAEGHSRTPTIRTTMGFHCIYTFYWLIFIDNFYIHSRTCIAWNCRWRSSRSLLLPRCFTGTKVLAVLVQKYLLYWYKSTNTDSGSAQQPRRGEVEMARSSYGGGVCVGDLTLWQELQISWNDGDSEDTLKRLGEVRLTL
jgi:hypothetical protein